MNQSIYSQPVVLNNGNFMQLESNLQMDEKPASMLSIANARSLEKRRNDNNWVKTGGNENAANTTTPPLNKRIMENKLMMFDVKSGFLDTSNTDMEQSWVR